MQSSTDLDGLKKKALVLVWIGQIWNIFEAVVALSVLELEPAALL
jgi:hypothetical protein